MEVYIVPALIAVAVLVALMGIRSLFPQRQRVDERLEGIRGEFKSDEAVGPSLTETSLPAFWRGVAVLGWVLPNLVQSEDLQWDLAQAGIRRREARGLFVGAKVVFTVGFAVLAFIGTTTLKMTQAQIALITIGSLALGFYIPNMWLALKASRRRMDILRGLPDALDLMVVCVEAGQGLNSALLTVGNEMRLHVPSLSEELRLITQEIRAGLTRAQALRNFAWRTGVDEARGLVAVLIQSDRLGTSIAKALRVHADSMRIRRRQRAEEAARKTAVKLVFPLVLCIFPELLVVILAPGMIQLFRALVESQTGGQ